MRAILSGLVLVAGCATGGEPSPADIAQDDDDVAALLAAMLRGAELTAMADAVVLGAGGSLDGFTTAAAGDVTGARDGVTYHYTFHCNDDLDNELSACSPAVNHAHVTVDITGGGLTHSSAWAVHDIGSAQPRIDHAAHITLHTSVADGSLFELTVDGRWNGVQFDPQPTLPHAGSIDTIQITAHRTRASAATPERDFDVTARVTFGAGGQATIVLDGTRNYPIDMATGGITRI